MFPNLMRPLLALALAALLGACSSLPTAPSDDYPREAAPRPFSVAFPDGRPGPPWAVEAALASWDALGACTGFNRAPAGLLVLDALVEADGRAGILMPPKGEWVGGFYLHESQEVHVIGDERYTLTWRHEQLHLLLDLEGQDSADHKSPLFAKCQ